MTNPFLEATTVRPTGAGRYEGSIDDAWNLNPLPQGGVVTAAALRAMAHHLDEPTQSLRTLHSTFVSQVAHGPITIEVELLRRGRSMSQLRAEVANTGSRARPPDHRHLRGRPTRLLLHRPGTAGRRAATGGLPLLPRPSPTGRSGLPGHALLAPSWSRPEACSAIPPGRRTFPTGPSGSSGTGSTTPRSSTTGRWTRWRWWCWPTPCPGPWARRSAPPTAQWFAPSVDLTVHLLDQCRSPWVLAHNRARFAGDGYASADMALWDCGEAGSEPARLVAYATQLFIFSFAP